jgi:transcriptional repressor NrdR
VGLAILGPLRKLDEVAYLRFASVYRAFESADDFEDEIAMLRAERAPVPSSPVELLDAAHSAPPG